MYYPKSQILENLYANPGQFVEIASKEEYTGPYYKTSDGSFYTGKKNFPKSEKYFNSAVSLPIYFDLSSKQQRMIINKIVSFFKKNESIYYY